MILTQLLLAGSLLSCFSGGKTAATDSTNIKNPCQEIVFNRKLAANLENRVVAAQQRRIKLSDEASAFHLAGCQQLGSAAKQAYDLLASIAIARSNKVGAELGRKAEPLLTAAQRLRKRADQLEAALGWKTPSSFTLIHTKGTEDANLLSSGSGKSCDVAITATPSKQHGCPTDIEDEAKIDADVSNIASLTSYKATPDSAFTISDLTGKLGAKGNIAGITTTPIQDKKACGTTGDDSNNVDAVNIGFRLATLTQSITWKTTTKNVIKQGTDGTVCEEDKTPEKHAFVSRKSVAFAICSARTPTIDIPQLLSDQKLNQLQEDADVKAAAILVSLGPSESAPSDNAQKSAVKAILGEGEETVHKKYLKGLEDNKMDFKIGTKAVKTGVISASTSSDFALAIGICLGDQYRKEIAEKKVESNTETIPEKNKECKGETDKDKCNKKDGCEFKDGECKTRVSAILGTSRNFTGGNSFVIHKAPLWLAFFLLE
uniref:Variant surface glycoprotein 1125.342 n=1 Tax=Trypanosoma brucei TaxID=5691 RepID=A0A1J0R5R4_9TRYP|nr:variant surface glycoprotein 1125.342 [Trypanosoma brucei]